PRSQPRGARSLTGVSRSLTGPRVQNSPHPPDRPGGCRAVPACSHTSAHRGIGTGLETRPGAMLARTTLLRLAASAALWGCAIEDEAGFCRGYYGVDEIDPAGDRSAWVVDSITLPSS